VSYKFTAIITVIAMLALSPSFMTTMTALAVKGDFGGNGSVSKHFDGDGSRGDDNSKQITNSDDRHFKNNDNLKFNNDNNGGSIQL
jgi:hypothetical protein